MEASKEVQEMAMAIVLQAVEEDKTFALYLLETEAKAFVNDHDIFDLFERIANASISLSMAPGRITGLLVHLKSKLRR